LEQAALLVLLNNGYFDAADVGNVKEVWNSVREYLRTEVHLRFYDNALEFAHSVASYMTAALDKGAGVILFPEYFGTFNGHCW